MALRGVPAAGRAGVTIRADGQPVERVYIDGAAMALGFADGVEVFRAPGITVPRIDSLGVAPPYAFRDAVIPGSLQFAVAPLIAGETITCHRGDGSNVPPTSPGHFAITPVPDTTETFTFTLTNQGGETLTRRYTWHRVTVPSWRNPTITRVRESGGLTITTLYRIAAEVFGDPKPTLQLAGDSWFRRAIGRVDLNRHLTGTGPYQFSLDLSVSRQAGHGFTQTATIRATVDPSGRTADETFAISIPGA